MTFWKLDLFQSSGEGGGEDTYSVGSLRKRTRASCFVWLLPLDLSGMGDPTSSYATASIALRVSGALKPHHHNKVETTSVEFIVTGSNKNNTICSNIT
jgi:hypothetical protein